MGALAKRLVERQRELGLSIKTLVKQAEGAGEPIHKATIYKYMKDEGAKHIPEHTVRALAAAFAMSPKEIRDLSGLPSGDGGPWLPPEESARLNRDERDVLDRLIKVFVRAHEAVTSPLSEVVTGESHHETLPRVAPAQDVSETGASPTEARGMGPRRTDAKRTQKKRAPRASSPEQDQPIPADG